MSATQWGFVCFGTGSQLVLAAYFAARRWAPRVSGLLGLIAYALGGMGLLVAAWLAAGGESWRLWSGPVLLALWAGFGAIVDIWRKIPWREPVRLSVFVPYVTLYFFAQMFLWWPLRDISFPAWLVFAVLFVANTGLNLVGHFGHDKPAAPA